jgi:hypothetical protein
MSKSGPFERQWQERFSCCLEQVTDSEIRRQVMAGGDELTADSDPAEVIAWTQEAMVRLGALVGADQQRAVMTGCACRYPVDDLRDVREEYRTTGSVERAHSMLQEKFAGFLRHTLALDKTQVRDVLRRGWGLAGILEGSTITATKIPKSGQLAHYLAETDADRQRELYCHCPRVHAALQTGAQLPAIYCYCGAGFYKGIWEEILQQPVQVTLLKSVLQGDEVCRVAIHLPTTETPSD